MEILICFFIFLSGLAVGSFLNCVIHRLEISYLRGGRGRLFPAGLLKARSYCPNCKHILSWSDLIPLFSFLILKGKCRYCSQKISWQYPIVELTTGILFLLIIAMYSNNYASSVYLLLISCFLIVIFVYDLKHYIIPDKVVYPAIVIAFLYQIVFNFQLPISITNFQFLITNFYPPFLSALGVATFFLLIVLISKGRWIGIGDIKLAFLMGLFLGFPNILVALFLAFFFGAIIGIGLIMAGKKTLKSELPFGPFLVTGTFLALFWGHQIINWYLNLL